MKYINFLYLLILLLSASAVIGQQTSESTLYQIGEVEFNGNKKTKGNYLLYHLSLDQDERFTREEIEQKVKDLTRLNGIYDVQYNIQYNGGIVNLGIQVEEQKTLLPVINFGQAEQYRWFQLGLVDINFLGKGNELYAYYQNNENRHAGQIFYRKPRILKSRFGYSFNLMKWSSIEPLYFGIHRVSYNYDNNLLGGSIHYNLNRYINLEFGSAYFVEKYDRRDFEVDLPNAPSNLELSKGLLKVAGSYNALRYHLISIEGHAFDLSYQFVETFENNELFNIVEGQYRYYKMFRNKHHKVKGNLAIRTVLGVSTNSNSPFSPFVIDSYRNIRGVGDRTQRGTALFTLNTEYRHEIWAKKKWAIQAVTFLDIGTIRTPGGEMTNVMDEQQFNEFAGLGARIIYKKIFNGMLRIDYAIDLSNSANRHFVIGLGQYF